MIKDKLTKKIGEILSERDSPEMAFTKGFRLRASEPPQVQNSHTHNSLKTKQKNKI